MGFFGALWEIICEVFSGSSQQSSRPAERPTHVHTQPLRQQRRTFVVHPATTGDYPPRFQSQGPVKIEKDEKPNNDLSYISKRQSASQIAERRKECIRLSKRAYENKNHSLAKMYSKQANELKQKMEKANETAAKEIFENLNPLGQSMQRIDLHGLYVNEAIKQLEKRINLVKRHNLESLIVIVGQGKHSEDGPRLKPAVIQFAQNRSFSYELNTPNPGCVCLSEF